MTVKEVSIAMTPAEEKAITRLQTRRRKTRKNMVGGDEIPMESEKVEIPSEKIENEIQTPAKHIEEQTVAAPIQSQNQVSQSGGIKVQIISRKKNQSISRLSSVSGTSKILPTKRHVTVKRKPTLVVGKQQGGENSQIIAAVPSPVSAGPVSSGHSSTHFSSLNSTVPISTASPVSATPLVPAVTSEIPMNTVAPVTSKASNVSTTTSSSAPPIGIIAPAVFTQQTGGRRKLRRFTERRLSITVKNAKATRKHKKLIRKKVKSMDIEKIRKTLLEKGILSPKSNPPEKMLRSMMKEYLLLQENA